MPLAPGSRFGQYEIQATIGAGGMGEVYRAHDTTLGRDVAVKALLPAVASDPDRLARFSREARVLASLNHPNIAQIYGLEEADGVRVLVLELVEGPTLADRVARGRVPPEEALPIAKQIADALEAAHEQGIVHRDLKPANIKLGRDGTVKVLDFGLAIAVEPSATSGANLSDSPTVTALTEHGMILGTAAYMSPEQAAGTPVDRRSDLWAFGVVLLEMLTGRRVFAGESVSHVLAAVLREEPDWSTLPADTPDPIRRLLRRCLQKDRKRRLTSAADARLEIEDALAAPAGEATSVNVRVPRAGWRRTLGFMAPVAAVCALAGALAAWMVLAPTAAEPTRFAIVPPSERPLALSGTDRDFAISADGRYLAYAAGPRGQLMVRAANQVDALPLDGITRARTPFFSPDARWIGFFTGISGELKKVPVAGGPAVSLCRYVGSPRGAGWGADDTIVFATNDPSKGLLRVSAAGGKPEMLTTLEPGQEMVAQHLFPSVLPSGAAVLFTIGDFTSGEATAQIAVLDLKTRQRKVLIRGGSQAQYVETGHLLYGARTALWAVRFDPVKLEVLGDPVLVVDQIMTTASGAAHFSVARDGTLAYIPGGLSNEVSVREFGVPVWVAREGREEPIGAPPRPYAAPHLSPDGTRAVLAIGDQEKDLWTWDFARQTLGRLTFDPSREFYPAWTRDGRRILFTSNRAGVPHIFSRSADGTGAEEQLTTGKNVQFGSPSSSPDGTHVVFTEIVPGTGEDIMMLSLDGARRVEPLLHSPFAERNGAISPDGRWLAYESNESGQEEIHVRPFPNVSDGGHWQVSAGGGTCPVWSPNGQELFYRDLNSVMAVTVQSTSTFSSGNPTKLFDGPYLTGVGGSYDASRDGQRFLMLKGSGPVSPARIVVVLNWFEELKAKVPAKR